MAVYSLDKLIEETRRLAAEFKRSTGTLLPVSGEIARYDVSRELDLTLNEQQNSSFDAIGNDSRAGLKVQIKSRVVGDIIKSSQRIGQLNPNGDWDLVILSLMNDDFEAMEMYQASHDEILNAVSDSNGKRSKRGAISIAKFKIISQLVWTRELGTNI